MTGSRMDSPGWDSLIAYVRPGDTLVVTELSRMTRSLLNLLETTKILEERQVDLVSLREKHRYQPRYWALFSVDDGCHPPDGTRIKG